MSPRLAAVAVFIFFTNHPEYKLLDILGYIATHKREKERTGAHVSRVTDCGFTGWVEVLDNLTQMEKTLVVQIRLVYPAGFNIQSVWTHANGLNNEK